MDLSRTVSEINGNLSRRSQFSLTPVYCTPSLNGFLLSIGAWVKKTEWWDYRAEGEVWRYL